MEDIYLKQNDQSEVERSNPLHLEILNTKLKRRKEMLEERISKKRLGSSNQYQSCSKIEEEKDEPLKPGVKDYWPVHLHCRNFHSSFKKKKSRRCWNVDPGNTWRENAQKSTASSVGSRVTSKENSSTGNCIGQSRS